MTTINHSAKMAIGRIVRSFDFPNHKDCFIEGIIQPVAWDRLGKQSKGGTGIDRDGMVTVKTTKRVSEGRSLGVTEDMTTTFPVSGMIFEYEDRIQVV